VPELSYDYFIIGAKRRLVTYPPLARSIRFVKGVERGLVGSVLIYFVLKLFDDGSE